MHTKLWRRIQQWRVLRDAALALALIWTLNISCGGISVLLPGRFAVTFCCGMLVWEDDSVGPPGLSVAWCPPKVLEDMGPPAPFLPFSRAKPLSMYTLGRGASLGIPLWPVVFGCGLLAWLLWRRQQRRIRLGHCATCGYALAGLPAMSPCPECGAIPGYGR